LLDILVAFGLFCHFKWVSKIEIFQIPFIGWNMWLNRYVPLRRGDGESIKKMYMISEERLREGSSVYFFPEGTRSKTGEMRPFKPGAFILAQKLQLPVLPIAISGTRAALPKYSLSFHGAHPITVEVLDEIPYEQFAHLSVDEVAAMVRQTIGESAGGLVPDSAAQLN
ncbi:lysophospholipid acyltransferase family protein, partial [Desulfobacterales bacterium HSG17]|nr:lysophospholipid acyltransferase family protein [Desulfobacterales bacterium HSG17]